MLVGAEEMLLPALGMIVLALTALRPKLDDCYEAKKEEVPCNRPPRKLWPPSLSCPL